MPPTGLAFLTVTVATVGLAGVVEPPVPLSSAAGCAGCVVSLLELELSLPPDRATTKATTRVTTAIPNRVKRWLRDKVDEPPEVARLTGGSAERRGRATRAMGALRARPHHDGGVGQQDGERDEEERARRAAGRGGAGQQFVGVAQRQR